MKKLILGFAASVCMLMAACDHGGTANAQPGILDSANAPIIKFDKPTYDFGKVQQGDSVTYSFQFANVGKSPLIISNAMASCGCTRPEWPTAPINPLKTGAIRVTFHSAGKQGLQDKMITITANTVPAQNIVHLIGEVQLKK